MKIALYDTESNGLLSKSRDKSQATKLHCIAAKIGDEWWSGCDQPGWSDRGVRDVTLPSGKVLKGVRHATIAEVLRALEDADLRIGINSQDFDERICRKFYPWWRPRGACLDLLHLSRLLFPQIATQGPNNHKVPPRIRGSHSAKAWGLRLGEQKNTDFDGGDWQAWSEDMQLYMLQDVVLLEPLLHFLQSRKPAPQASNIEHGFAAIIRRQEAWGFTIDYPKLLSLQADLVAARDKLEGELIGTFGEWWEPGKTTVVKANRRVKMSDYPDVTLPRWNAKGERLSKDYVGPPLCHYEKGAVYTPISRVEFNPSSRDHVIKMLTTRYGWKPKKMTDGGKPKVDDDVLRSLDASRIPEAPLLADYFAVVKYLGFVSEGKNAWMRCVYEEGPDYRMHGKVITIGTYTHRCSHYEPNCGQIPTRDPKWGHRCRDLFIARPGFQLVGFDGSGMQLRLLAHYLAKGGRFAGSGDRWGDGGTYANVFIEGRDPHAFMRDSIGTDLMGEGEDGRGKGKTLNYALCFGGGERKLGSIIEPTAKEARQKELGKVVKDRMLPVFGTSFDDLKAALKDVVLDRHYVVGLDGRQAPVAKPHAALAALLQMGEGVVMKQALIIMDDSLQQAGLRPGVGPDGVSDPAHADYEFTANVHDEAQADVREEHVELYSRLAREAVPKAGTMLGVLCPLRSDVKVGHSWRETH